MTNEAEQSAINGMINCLETSNKLLNTYHKETQPGLKRDTIQKMIETNSFAISSALEYQAGQQAIEGEIENVGRFVLIPEENYNELTELIKGMDKRNEENQQLLGLKVDLLRCADLLRLEDYPEENA